MIDVPIMTTEKTAQEIGIDDVIAYIRQFNNIPLKRLIALNGYYEGRHAILNRQKAEGLSNNRIAVNFASYIADLTSAYLTGSPVKYTAPEGVDIKSLLDVLKKADSATQDSDLALDAAVFGTCYELVYMSSDPKPEPRLARLSPLNTFVVYDDTVEQNPVFAVYYYPVKDKNGNLTKYKGSYYTDSESCDFTLTPSLALIPSDKKPERHYFGAVPINEIYNDGRRSGDFEQVTSLIDAYNTLQSDRVNDKEQFVDAILLISGAILGDTDSEKDETYRAIREHRVMELNDGATAQYLARQFDEGSVEVLQRRIEQSIHKISKTPDMSDENFASNVSGVAMRYKLLPLEERTTVKERYFAEGLRYRLMLLQNVAEITGSAKVDISEIEIKFSRSLPVNELEIAQTAQALSGIVPQETILSMVPAVTDVEAAMEKLELEKQEAAERQQAMFSNSPVFNN